MNRYGSSRGTDCAAILLLFANRKRKVTSLAAVNNEQSHTVTTALNRITVTLRNMIRCLRGQTTSSAASPNRELNLLVYSADVETTPDERAAVRLGLKRTTLQSRMLKYNIARLLASRAEFGIWPLTCGISSDAEMENDSMRPPIAAAIFKSPVLMKASDTDVDQPLRPCGLLRKPFSNRLPRSEQL